MEIRPALGFENGEKKKKITPLSSHCILDFLLKMNVRIFFHDSFKPKIQI